MQDASGEQVLDKARTTVGEVVWETAIIDEPWMDEFLPIPEVPVTVVGEREAFVGATESLAAGSRVLLGFTLLGVPGEEYYLSFALDTDPQAPSFMGSTPYAERNTGQFRAFLSWHGNPLQGTDPLNLVRQWNVEADAPVPEFPALGPIGLSWQRFVDEARGRTTGTRGTPAGGRSLRQSAGASSTPHPAPLRESPSRRSGSMFPTPG